MDADFPRRGSLLGIDYGRKRIGVAVCDKGQSVSSPLEPVARVRDGREMTAIARLAEDYDAAGFVVGLPLHANGDESDMSREARGFGRLLNEASGLPVTFFDERYTSAQAEDFLIDMNVSRHRRRHGERDMLAAHYILAGFLQERRNLDSPEAETTGGEPRP